MYILVETQVYTHYTRQYNIYTCTHKNTQVLLWVYYAYTHNVVHVQVETQVCTHYTRFTHAHTRIHRYYTITSVLCIIIICIKINNVAHNVQVQSTHAHDNTVDTWTHTHAPCEWTLILYIHDCVYVLCVCVYTWLCTHVCVVGTSLYIMIVYTCLYVLIHECVCTYMCNMFVCPYTWVCLYIHV